MTKYCTSIPLRGSWLRTVEADSKEKAAKQALSHYYDFELANIEEVVLVGLPTIADVWVGEEAIIKARAACMEHKEFDPSCRKCIQVLIDFDEIDNRRLQSSKSASEGKGS